MPSFKIFTPSGEARRAYFESVPDLVAIHDVVANILGSPVDEGVVLTYVDSEGDRVAIKSSADVAEAVRDAAVSDPIGARSIRVQARRVRKEPPATHEGSNGSGKKCMTGGGHRSCGTRKARLSPYSSVIRSPFAWAHHRCHPGFFTVDVSDTFDDDVQAVLDVCADIFPGFFGTATKNTTTTTSTSNSTSNSKKGEGDQDGGADGNNKKTTSDKEEEEEKKEAAPVAAPAGDQEEPPAPAPAPAASPVEVILGSTDANEEIDPTTGTTNTIAPTAEDEVEDANFVKVEIPSPRATTKPESAPKAVGNLAEKVKLLREMGFEMPKDVAESMITQMGGRMDLLVRALVANNK